MQRLWQIDATSPPFVHGKEQLTKQLKQYVVDLCRVTTMQSAAGLAGLSWDTVKGIIKSRLSKDYAHIRLKDIKRLAIDEIYLGHKHKFMTIVIDHQSGRIVWVANGRGSDALKEFFRRLKASTAVIEAISMDMSGAYSSAVAKWLPSAIIVFDRFHVVKKMNEHIDDLRRELAREAKKSGQPELLKGSRWLLLRNNANLDEDQKQALKNLLKVNQPLACAYVLKEELGWLWAQVTSFDGLRFLTAWCEKARASGIEQLKKMAKTLENHAEGILSFFRTGMTNGKMEGINRKIKTMLAQVYGLRDEDFLKLKLFALHEAAHRFIG